MSAISLASFHDELDKLAVGTQSFSFRDGKLWSDYGGSHAGHMPAGLEATQDDSGWWSGSKEVLDPKTRALAKSTVARRLQGGIDRRGLLGALVHPLRHHRDKAQLEALEKTAFLKTVRRLWRKFRGTQTGQEKFLDDHFKSPEWDKFHESAQDPEFRTQVAKHPGADDKMVRFVNTMGSMHDSKAIGSVPGGKGTYDIKELPGGRLGCSCKDWRYARSHQTDPVQQDCKHIKRWKEGNQREKAAFLDELAKVATLEEAKDKAKPGDVVLMSMAGSKGGVPGALEKAFRVVSPKLQGGFTHSAIVTGEGELVEARLGEGVEKKTFDKALKGHKFVLLRPGVHPSKRRKAARFAEGQVGKEYSLKQLVASGAGLVLPRSLTEQLGKGNKERGSYTCSNLISASYGDDDVTGLGSLAVPADFYRNAKTVHLHSDKVIAPEAGRTAKAKRREEKGKDPESLYEDVFDAAKALSLVVRAAR